jgi:hypothetical protein
MSIFTERTDLFSPHITELSIKGVNLAISTMEKRRPDDTVWLKLLKSPDMAAVLAASLTTLVALGSIQYVAEITELGIRAISEGIVRR